jgi:hypothetical protein
MPVSFEYRHGVGIDTGEKMMIQANKNRSAISELDMRHGSPYDRGRADSYYQRPFDPHYFVKDTYNSPKISAADMSAAEVVLYAKGFTDNEERGHFKDWGGPHKETEIN